MPLLLAWVQAPSSRQQVWKASDRDALRKALMSHGLYRWSEVRSGLAYKQGCCSFCQGALVPCEVSGIGRG